MVTNDFTEIVCDHCGTGFTGDVWVYPDHTEFEIEEPHKLSFTGDVPMYGPPEDEDYEPAEDPHSVAKEALAHLTAMVGSSGPDNDDQFTNRLIFSGAVASLEAYLGDTLINAVIGEPIVRDSLVKNNKVLGGERATAAEIATDPDILQKRIVEKLRSYLYHNLRLVMALYKDAFKINLVPEQDRRNLLFKAMERRHDCVHRNGSNKDGVKLTDFTDDYVREVIAAIEGVVDHVENERSNQLPF